MGKQRDFRHVHPSNKKKDKKFDKSAKPTRASSHVGFLKNVEEALQVELESVANSKMIGRKVCKELERYPILAKAVFLGCERIVDNILETGENVNITVPDGSTPLIIAVENGYSSIVPKLLKKGADPKLLRQDGRNALMVSVSKNDNRSFQLIWNFWDKNSFWELNHSDLKGYTALTIAAEQGYSQFIQFFLSLNGIEIDKQTKDGDTPLMLAVLGGHNNVVNDLITSGSDIMLENKSGATALCLAISQNQMEIKNQMIESLDNKVRETYVKKRIELLEKPRLEDIQAVISFYKDILFPVILEIRKYFQDGVILLQKYHIFKNLLKCIDTYQQDATLLKSAFHLAACIMYDNAEDGRYVVEELAEQYIQAKGLDFSLKIITNRRIKSFADTRGAAFLPINACCQYVSGKIWLKENYFQLHPYAKEFKIILPTLVFLSSGEKVKTQIMFHSFEEILKFTEKEVKTLQPELSEKSNFSADETAKQPENVGINDPVCEPGSVCNQQQWCLVSNAKSSSSKSASKSKNKTSKSHIAKNEAKKKSKAAKLQNRINRKTAGKKNLQKANIKPFAGTSFPAATSKTKFSATGYADALKKNLSNEESVNKCEDERKDGIGSQVPSNFPYEGSNLFDWTDDSNIELHQEKSTNNPQEMEKLESRDGLNHSFKKENPLKVEEVQDSLAKITYSGKIVGTMTRSTESCETTNRNPTFERKMKVSERFLSALKKEDPDDSSTRLKNNTKHFCYTAASLRSQISVTQNSIEITDRVETVPGVQASGDLKEESLKNILKGENSVASVTDENNHISDANDLENIETLYVKQKSNLSTTSKRQSALEMLYRKKSSKTSTGLLISTVENSTEISKSISTCQAYKRKCVENNPQGLNFSFLREEVKESIQENFNLEQLFGSKGHVSNRFKSLQTEKENKLIHSHESVSMGKSFSTTQKSNFQCIKLEFNSNENFFPREASLDSGLEHEKVLAVVSRETNLRNIPKKLTEVSTLVTDFSFGFPHVLVGISHCNSVSKKSTLCLMIDGKFSNFIPKSVENKQDSKFFSRVPSLCPFSILLFTSNVKLANLQNCVMMHQRAILHKMLSWMQMNKSCLHILPSEELILSSSSDEKSEDQSNKYVRNYSNFCFPSRPIVLESDKCLANKEEWNVLRFKKKHILFHKEMKAAKHRIFQSSKGTLKSLKSSCKSNNKRIKQGINKTKNTNTRRIKPNDLNSKSESMGSIDIRILNDVWSYKPQFINCESTSRWYKILRRIESCIPLATFLMDPSDVKTICTECPLHELIYPQGKIVYSTKEEHILNHGYFGTFLGLLSNGNPVVVRQYQKSSSSTVKLLIKKRHANHRNITAFYCVSDSLVDEKMFTATELCEFSLPEYLKNGMILKDRKFLVQDLIEAVRFLHDKKIVHGFLKPSNVMVTIDHILKVTDYYQLDISPLIHGAGYKAEYKVVSPRTSLTTFSWRPYELIAATTETEARQYLTSASDVQMTGMLIYYILSGGKHPFGSTDQQCQENIQSGRPELGPKPIDVESRGLVRDMIRRVPSTRPNMSTVVKHPYFWIASKRFQFLTAVARKIEFYTSKQTKISEALQSSCIEARDWTRRVNFQLLEYIGEITNRKYENNFVDLLLFIAAVQDNLEIMPPHFRRFIQEPSFFLLKTFPTIFMSVYSVIRDNPVVQRQMTLETYF